MSTAYPPTCKPELPFDNVKEIGCLPPEPPLRYRVVYDDGTGWKNEGMTEFHEAAKDWAADLLYHEQIQRVAVVNNEGFIQWWLDKQGLVDFFLAQVKAIMPGLRPPPTPREEISLEAVVAYLRADEEKDYEACEEDATRDNHIHNSVLVLEKYLTGDVPQ